MAALLAGLSAFGAEPLALQSCSGKLSASLINPLPRQTVVRVHITDGSSGNMALAARFRVGLTAAGAAISEDGNVSMEFATSITGLPESYSGTGAVSPEFGLIGRLPIDKVPPDLTMSISILENKRARIDWVGYIECKVHDPDLGRVMQDLGFAIGRSLGQTFSPRSF